MADNHPFRVAAAATAGVYDGVLLEAGVKRTALPLGSTESLGDFEFSTGEIPLAIIHAATGYLYFYDSTDSTTADDGLTCLVTGNGLRYHIQDAASISLNSALSFETAPPGSPTVGDVHIVDAAATGAFAGHDDDIAVYTRRGWVFATPEVGMALFLEDTETNWQFTASGWGGFAVQLDDGSVRPEALLLPLGLAVESTENTPPGAPAADTYWLVGTSPTGDFTGHANDVAYYAAAAWQFLDAYEGATIFHKDFGFLLHFVSGVWLGGSGSDLQEFSTAGADTWTKPAKGTMAFIQCWGAGGSGGRAGTSDKGGGGGGGAYTERWMKLADLAATVAVTVGAGGAARTSDGLDGIAGGDSSFGAHLTGYGGGGGGGNTSDVGGGGGGGGDAGAGNTGVSTASGNGGLDYLGNAPAGGSGGSAGANGVDAGGGGGGSSTGGSGGSGGNSRQGGGGGGGGSDTATGGSGGKSKFGGGGGAAAGSGGSHGTGGASQFGGAGGGYGAAGTQPGGGGGGSITDNSGKGGDGRVRVTVI